MQDRAADTQWNIAMCHQVLRAATALILGSFVLIIVATTISNGPFVQVLGKGLYYAIVISAVVSLLTWVYRTRLERQMEASSAPAR
jgi:membrane protein implicated in regulation of membrane protease activity